MKNRLYLFFGLIFLLSLSFQSHAREIKVHVAVTADVHGHLFPYDFMADKPRASSLANVHYLTQAIRTRSSNNLILLDNGDLIQGTTAAYYANFVQESDKNLFSRVLNFMKYDAATIGNHDIEAGPEVYNRLTEEFDFPWLGANVLKEGTQEPYFKPYTIIERSRIRIAVLGLTTTGVPQWLPPQLWDGLEFQDMVEAAAYWVPYIKENENPDAIIGLFHSGRGPDELREGEPTPDNASALVARNVPGFDVIFTSHDHRERIEKVTNVDGKEVLLVGPGHFAEKLGIVEMKFDRLSRREFNLKETKAELIETREIAPSQEFIRRFESDVSEILEFSNKPVGKLGNTIHSIEALFGSAPFADLVHQVQLDITGADISFTAPLSFDITLREGTLRTKDFFALYQYENYLYTMELSGQEIKDHLEFSYDLWVQTMQDENDHMLNFRLDEQGGIPEGRTGRGLLRNPFFNFDSAAGIIYTVDVSKPSGERIYISEMEDGSAFDPDGIYSVAINSYRGSGGGGHLTRGSGIDREELSERMVFSTDTDLRTVLMNYFRENSPVPAQKRGNWKFIPETWVEKAKERDLKLLRAE